MAPCVAAALALSLAIAALALAPSLGEEAYAQTFSSPPATLKPTLEWRDESARRAPPNTPPTLDGVTGVDAFTLLNGDTHVITAAPGGSNDANLGNHIWRIRVLENADFETTGNNPEGDSVSDGERGFTALRSASYVEAFTLRNSSTFAMVVAGFSGGDNGVQLVHVLENGTMVAAGTAINGTQDANGDTYDRLVEPTGVDVFTLANGERYALVTSDAGDSVQLIRIHEDGAMFAADSASHVNNLSNAWTVAAFDLLDGNTYALVGGRDSTRIALLRVHEGGSLTTETVAVNGANGFNALGGGTNDMVSFTLRNGSTYALAATWNGNGVQLIRVHEDKSLTGADSLVGSAGGFSSDGTASVVSVDAFEMDGDTYALVGSHDDAGSVTLHLIRVHEDGTLERVDSNYQRWVFTPEDISVFTLRDGSTHAAVAFSSTDGLYMYDVALPAPSVRYVSSAYADGSYNADVDVDVTVVFDGRVYVGAEDQPKLLMNTGRNATYVSGNGTTALTFEYDVQEGDPTAVLDQNSTDALAGTIANYLGVPADPELPAKGSGNTLGERKRLVADDTPPSIASVSSPYDDMYGPHAITDPGAIIPIAVEFDEAVVLYEGESAPTLELAVGAESNGMAVYASGNGSSTLVFKYVVREGDRTGDLNYTGTGALSLNGGSIRDAAGNVPDNLDLPDPNAEGSLGASEAIMIDTSLSPPPSTLSPTLISELPNVVYDLTLQGVTGLDAFKLLNGDTYLITAARGQGGQLGGHAVQLIRVHENATLERGAWANDTTPGFDALRGAKYVDAFRLRDGSTYAIVTSLGDSSSLDDDGVQLVRVHENGTLQGAGSLHDADADDLTLQSPNRVHVFALRNGDTYAMVSSSQENSVQLIRVHENGTMAPAGSLNATGALARPLNSNRAATTFVLGDGDTYGLTGGQGGQLSTNQPVPHGVAMYRVYENGEMVVERAVLNGSNGFDKLDGSNGIAAFAMRNGSTYALSASSADNGVQLIRVNEGAPFVAADSAGHGDPGFSRLRGANGVASFALDGDTYALVSAFGGDTTGETEPGVQLIRVFENGTLEGAGSATHLIYQGSRYVSAGVTDVTSFTLRNGSTYGAAAVSTYDTVELLAMPMPPPSLLRVVAGGGNTTYYGSADISVVFDGRVYINSTEAMPVLQLGGGRSAEYHSGNGTTALTFRYDVPLDEQAVLDQQSGTDLGGMVTNYLGARVNTTLPANGSGNTLGERNEVRVDGTVARVLSVSSTAPNPVYGPGDTIPITVTFSRGVTVTYPNENSRPSILLETGDNDRSAIYDSGSGGTELVFNYDVEEGDLTADLDYQQGDIVVPAGASITDIAGNRDALLMLPLAGSGNSLAEREDIEIDGVRPTVVSVNSTVADKAYGINARIDVQVEFSETVRVMGGIPLVPLETGSTNPAGSARYVSGSGSDTLVFEYTVLEDDETADLDHGGALLLDGATIEDGIGNAAVLDLSALGGSGLGDLKEIVIDGIRPTVLNVTSPAEDRPRGTGARIDVWVAFSEIVLVNNTAGNPAVPLDTGGAAAYDSGSGSGNQTLVFVYTVGQGEASGDLDHGSALSFNGGNITDTVGNTAYTTLPLEGSDNRLGDNKAIIIDTAAPGVDSVEAVNDNTLRIIFDEYVVSGDTAASAGWYISGDDAENLSFVEAVPLPDPQMLLSLGLNASLPDAAPAIVLHYDASTGGIRDVAGNAMPSSAATAPGGIAVADHIPPTIVGSAALITGENEVSIAYTEPVSAGQGAYGDLRINGVPRTIDPHSYGAPPSEDTHVLGFAGDPAPHAASGTMMVDGAAVLDGAGPPQNRLDLSGTLDIYDGRTLTVINASTGITGNNTAVIMYTRPAAAQQGAYTSLVVDGESRDVMDLDGGDGAGSRTHTITFSPAVARPDATGSVVIDGAAVTSGEDRLEDGATVQQALRDRQEPSVRGATAVSLDTIQVEFDEAVEPGANTAAAAAGWTVSGADAAGRAVDTVQNAEGRPDMLVLVLDAGLPNTGPEALRLLYSQADGSASDAAGNPLGYWDGPVADGIAPTVVSSFISGPNTAEVQYTERVWAGPGAYGPVSLDSGGGTRAFAGLAGNGTAVHTISFEGEGVARDETGMLAVNVSAVLDYAGNALDAESPLTLADAQPPTLSSATAVSLNTIRAVFDKPVSAPGAGAAGWSVSGGDAAGLVVESSQDVPLSSPSESLLLTLSADLPSPAPDDIALSYDPAAAGGNVRDAAGNAPEAAMSVEVADGIAPTVVSSFISGPNTAEVQYTERVWAGPGAYGNVSLDSGGEPRAFTGLAGNGTAVHTISFEGEGAARDETGMLALDASAVLDYSGNALDAESSLTLADAQPPTLSSATAVSLNTIRAVFDKPVSAPGAGAAGWSVSGVDAAGISVASTQDVPLSSPSESLVLTLSSSLPDTAPDDVVLSYDPAAAGASVRDAAGNAPDAAMSVEVADGIAPAIVPESSLVSGPNTAEVQYTEPVWAATGAYASVWVSSGGGPRAVSGLEGNGTETHTVAFDGAAAAPGATGIMEVNKAAVRDAAMNLLVDDGLRQVELGGRAPTAAPSPDGNDTASVLSAVFTARNEATIVYSADLGPPAGYDGPVYTVSVYGEDADRTVTNVEGPDTAVHTVQFDGAGIDRGQNGTITLEVGLEGAGGERIGAGAVIPVAPGAAVQAVLVLPSPQQGPPEPVVIEPRGFTRIVDATPSGGSARLAINVSGLAVAPDDDGGPAAPGTAVFPDDEAVTLSATFAVVTFPPGVTAVSVPADGVIALRVSTAEPPSDADVSRFLDYEGAGELELRPVIIEAGDDRMPVVFDMPVRILLAGQAMGRAFYINASSGAAGDAQIAPIDRACGGDDAQRVHVQLGGSGECQLDSGADKVVYTYHMTRFGTVESGSGAPPPDGLECSVRLSSDGTGMTVVAGNDYSSAVARGVANSGSEPFDSVGIEAEPWAVVTAPGANATSLPANSTSLSLVGPMPEGFAPLAASGTYVAQGKEYGTIEPLWFMLNMTGRDLPVGSALAQDITYTASCSG